MTYKEVIKEALDDCGWSQKTLAEKAGYGGQAGIGNKLSKRNSSMKVNEFIEYLSLMGYEVIVKSSSDKKNPVQWKVTTEDESK